MLNWFRITIVAGTEALFLDEDCYHSLVCTFKSEFITNVKYTYPRDGYSS